MDEPQKTRVGVRDLRGNLSGYLRGTPGCLVPRRVARRGGGGAAPGRAPRQPGRLRGQIRVDADFDTMPPDLLAAMTGDDIPGTSG